MLFFEFPEDARWNDERDCVEFSVILRPTRAGCGCQDASSKGWSRGAIVEFSVGGSGALFERVYRQSGQVLSDDPLGRAAQHLAIDALGIIIVEDRRIHLPTLNIARSSQAFSAPMGFV